MPQYKIKDKITDTGFDLDYLQNPDVTNPTTATAIKTALKAANSTLTDSDLTKITFAGGPLEQGKKNYYYM